MTKILSLVLGASIYIFQQPGSPVVLTEMQDTGIPQIMQKWKEEYGDGWWPWGVVAFDYDRDGDNDILVVQHNGGSKIFRNDGGKFTVADVGSALGGTHKPRVWDFDGDGWPDLAYADSKPNTCWFNRGGKFEPMGYAIGTNTSMAIAFVRPDFIQTPMTGTPDTQIRYYYNPFTKKLEKAVYDPPAMDIPWVKTLLQAEYLKSKQFFRSWPVQRTMIGRQPGHVVTWFASYDKVRGARFIINDTDATEALGLPKDGAVCHVQDLNGDRQSDFIIVGHGLYLSTGPKSYALKPGPITDFVKTPGVYLHVVHATDFNHDRLPDLVICNPRAQDTRIFANLGGGNFNEIAKIGSWDGGDPCAVADMNGDGLPDVCIGTGDNVKILLSGKGVEK